MNKVQMNAESSFMETRNDHLVASNNKLKLT